ncbi:hypothetical protein [Nostoc sphaeroides]|nr:hypothetical protein [Nostoc sphaeroides]
MKFNAYSKIAIAVGFGFEVGDLLFMAIARKANVVRLLFRQG